MKTEGQEKEKQERMGRDSREKKGTPIFQPSLRHGMMV